MFIEKYCPKCPDNRISTVLFVKYKKNSKVILKILLIECKWPLNYEIKHKHLNKVTIKYLNVFIS